MRPKTSTRGFVLIMVLAMLVILSALAATIAVTSDRVRREEEQRQAQLQASIAMASTRATVLYALTTRRMTFGGLTVDDRITQSLDEPGSGGDDDSPASLLPVGNEIRLDGTAYAGPGDARFALQDDRGLLAVNWAPPLVLQGLLEQRPVAGAPPLGTLQNLLLDYQDRDDLYRINSAESDGYRKLDLPPPTNRPLANPGELRAVIGWKSVLAVWDDVELLDLLSVSRNPALNVNTATLPVLDALPGVDATMAQRLLDARELQVFTSTAALAPYLGAAAAGEEGLSLYPSASGTIRLWASTGGTVQVMHWTLTPYDDGGRPWREDYEFTIARADTLDARPARTPQAAVFKRTDAPSQ